MTAAAAAGAVPERPAAGPDSSAAQAPRAAGPAAAADPAPDDSAVAAWLTRLRTQRRYSPATLASYRFDLDELQALLDGRAWNTLTEADVRRWIAARARGGLSPRSIARTLSCWRGFFDFLAETAQVLLNPVRGVRAPKAPRRLPKALSPDMARQLVDAPADGRAESLRDKALIELFYSSGLRLSELIGLDAVYRQRDGYRSRSWIDLPQAQATVFGKGGKTRELPIGRPACEALRAWLAAREQWLAALPGADRDALFLSRRGTRLSARSVQVIVKRMALEQGIPANVHPHVLRHSFASHLLQSSGDLRAVQELLGHANISTTQVYTSLDFQRLAAVYDAAHPRAHRRKADRR